MFLSHRFSFLVSERSGQGGAPPSAVADAMIDAVIDFVKKKKGKLLQSVKFLIFQTSMVSDFHQSMLKRQQESVEEGGGVMGWFKGVWMNPVNFQAKMCIYNTFTWKSDLLICLYFY